MKLSDFASEYDPPDLSALSGSPMNNLALSRQIDAMAPATRVQEAQVNLLADVVFSYYFTKRVFPELEWMATAHRGPLGSAYLVVRTNPDLASDLWLRWAAA